MRQAFSVTCKYTPEEGQFYEIAKRRNEAMDRFITEIQL